MENTKPVLPNRTTYTARLEHTEVAGTRRKANPNFSSRP